MGHAKTLTALGAQKHTSGSGGIGVKAWLVYVGIRPLESEHSIPTIEGL